MLYCATLWAVLLLTPCSAFIANIPSLGSLPTMDAIAPLNIIPNITSIINPLFESPKEMDSKELNESLDETEPRLTVWEFPTERRVFFGDVEVFVSTGVDPENSNETIDPLNIFLRHPHKHRLHKELGEEPKIPNFRAKTKRGDETDIFSELKQGLDNSSDDIVKYLSKLTADKHNARSKRLIHFLNRKETIASQQSDKWRFADYLRWLLEDDELPESTTSSNNENQDQEINDINKQIDIDKSDISTANIENQIKEIINIKKLLDIDRRLDKLEKNVNINEAKLKEILTDNKVRLAPASPKLLKVLNEQDKNVRGKRNIATENNILVNLLTAKKDKDDNKLIV